jgi:hypothetical protein
MKRGQPPPVSFEKHFEVFKSIEAILKKHLESLEGENLLIGLRVAYDEKDSSSEPGVYPFSVESGYLELVDNALKCGLGEELTEEELIESTMKFPLPMTLLDKMYGFAKTEFEGAASVELNVGVFTEVKSNPITYGGVACGCGGSTTKKLKVAGINTTNTTKASCRQGC